MTHLLAQLWNEESGFVVSAELVLISTLAMLAMVVGMSEVSHGIHRDLGETSSAFGRIRPTNRYSGLDEQQNHSSGGSKSSQTIGNSTEIRG